MIGQVLGRYTANAEPLTEADYERMELNYVRRPKHIGKFRDPNTIKRLSSRNDQELELLFNHFSTLTASTRNRKEEHDYLEQKRNDFMKQNRLDISRRLYMTHLIKYKQDLINQRVN
jgi:hypothetical protein